MTSGDLLRKLFQAYARRDDEAVRSAALQIVATEREKNHRLLADDLERIILNGATVRWAPFKDRSWEIPKDRERGLPLAEVLRPTYDWNRIVLPPGPQRLLMEVAEESRRRDVLAAHGLRPRQRLLFYGPPGCGKTLAAHIVAGALSVPLVVVRFDAVVSSYLGETAANLRSVFDFAKQGDWVVLFDEFDAIGKDRDNAFEHGELKRVVNALLQLMDEPAPGNLLIAATNHEKLLDSAVWRRFDAVVQFSLPPQQDRVLMLQQYLRGMDTAGLRLASIARRLSGASGSDIERVAVDAARRAVLSGRGKLVTTDFTPAISDFRRREKELGPGEHDPAAVKG